MAKNANPPIVAPTTIPTPSLLLESERLDSTVIVGAVVTIFVVVSTVTVVVGVVTVVVRIVLPGLVCAVDADVFAVVVII